MIKIDVRKMSAKEMEDAKRILKQRRKANEQPDGKPED